MPVIQGELIVEFLTVGPFQTNVYVIGCAKTREGVIIDAGGDGAGLLALAAQHDLELISILQTHAHIDHVAALSEVRQVIDAPIYLHPDEAPLYEGAPQQGLFFGMAIEPLPRVDVWMSEGDVIEIGDLRAEVILAPGHSPGSVIFYFEAQETMISGDVLFAGSIGRVDLPGSDVNAMRASLKKLATYPDATRIYSGHGPDTSLGKEKQTNPFLTQDW
ncbi:unnamed protein product [Laminaria digitata]